MANPREDTGAGARTSLLKPRMSDTDCTAMPGSKRLSASQIGPRLRVLLGQWMSCAALLLALPACQNSSPSTNAEQSAPSNESAGNRVADQGGQAAAASCAPLPPAPKEQPVDDVIGLRAGQTLPKVETFLKCRDPNYRWMRMAETMTLVKGRLISVKTLRALARDEDIYVRFSGALGKERAFFLQRTANYRGLEQPPLADLKTSVFKKYGPFQSWFDHTESFEYGSQSRGNIVYLKDGRRVGRENQAYWKCTKASTTHHDMYVSPECGLTVTYLINLEPTGNSVVVTIYDYRILEQLAAQHEASSEGKPLNDQMEL